MSAQSLESHDPLDPDTILRDLPPGERDRFLVDYRAALAAAHETWRYRQLQDVLRLWHMRAVAYAQPDFTARARAARADRGERVPAEQAIPGWADHAGQGS
ncbi:DUF6247 family protein [Rhizohabitans arisaemae]|uniref:DUF6247 family protein n=1 Tax=Rhizohabitans arisaemae TaxID=2720610 RepID=UPI0024B128A9|nr:DUF6247 family protein [Rhizohabitans arisaemae]